MITKEEILHKARIMSNRNVKLGDMGVFAKLYGDGVFYIPELDMEIKGTCGNHCCGCYNSEDPRKSPCYVAKSYVRHTKRNDNGTIGNIMTGKCSVKLGHAYRTLAMRNYIDDLFAEINKQLVNKKKKFKFVRWNESGEIESFDELQHLCFLASCHKETKFYIYTKNYGAVREAIWEQCIPSNMFILISVWHLFGISEYLEFSKHPQIKAFAVVDDEWDVNDYARYGVGIGKMCPAYSKTGKLNHDITCDKCRMCMNRNYKVIGCFEH